MTKLPTLFIHTNIRLLFSTFISLNLVISLFPADIAHADANQLLVTPNSSQMNKGTTFCIDVKSYSDSDQSDGTAIGTLTYPSSKLQVKEIYKNGTTCTGTTSNHYGQPSTTQQTGKIIFDASRNPAPGGIAQIIGVKFKSIGSGTAVVGFTSNSKVNASTTIYQSGVYTITDPAPPPSPSPTPKPIPITPTPAISDPEPKKDKNNGTDTIVTPDPTGLVDNVNIDGAYTTATISWSVNTKNSKSTLKYGADSINIDTNAKVKKKSDTFSTTISNLEPGKQYYFTITGTGEGNKGEYSGTIYTRGYPIVLTITENNIPAANAQVSIGNISRSTDENGKLPLALSEGDYSGKIVTSTSTLNINLTVKKTSVPVDGTAPIAQTYPYNLTSSILEQGPGTGTSLLAFVGILAVGLVVLGIGFVGYVSYRKRRFETGDATIQSGTTSVVVDDGYNWQQQNTPQPVADPAPLPTQLTPIQTPLPPSSRPIHNNSVYIEDDEPVDMFDQPIKATVPEPPKPAVKENITVTPQVNITPDKINDDGSSMTIPH